jgi:hypothetical protein
LTRTGRLLAGLAPLVVGALLLTGSLVGEDDQFPFGPFRMYATKQGLDGRVRVPEIWGLKEGAGRERLPPENFGLRRADLEGQLGKLAEPPTFVLARLAESYRRLHDGEFPFDALELRQRIYLLEKGVPVGDRLSAAIASWRP